MNAPRLRYKSESRALIHPIRLDSDPVMESKRADRADERRLHVHAHEAVPTAPGRTSLTGVDVFWPILTVILVLAVIFVSVMARLSMRDVGSAPSEARPSPRATAFKATVITILIVQVSSHPSRPKAQAAARQLIDHGYPAQILKSDDYQPLNPGFFVVYLGPYPGTAAGHAAAKHLQARLPGALIREIQRR